MRSPPSARFALRAATADRHASVDARFGQADLTTRAGLGAFLHAQAAAFLPVEAALERDGVAAVLPDWAQRRRSDALRDDLAELGIAPPPPAGTVDFGGTAALLGGAYVLEGSRLGGAMLRRSVAPGLPTRFLDPADPGLWRGFVAALDGSLADADAVAEATRAAQAVFALFERAGVSLMREHAA